MDLYDILAPYPLAPSVRFGPELDNAEVDVIEVQLMLIAVVHYQHQSEYHQHLFPTNCSKARTGSHWLEILK